MSSRAHEIASCNDKDYLLIYNRLNSLCFLCLFWSISVVMAERHNLIFLYYSVGMSYGEILLTLAHKHNVVISERHLKRILRQAGVGRCKYSDLVVTVRYIQSEIEGAGALHGYRMMHSKCIQHGLQVRKEDVRLILRELDPRGVDDRMRRRLVRRSYHAVGPNAVWHIDGYDKIKPFGMCINGCIDGFSRKVIWLNVYFTNNDPKVIGGYYLEAVKECNGCPRRVRGDFGTENTYVRDFQALLRHCAVADAYVEGASTLNQRIESWWAFLYRQCMHYWIDYFRRLQYNGAFVGDFVDKGVLQFCFTAQIQVLMLETSVYKFIF